MSNKFLFNRMLVVYTYLCNFDCSYCMHKDLRHKVGEENRIAEDRLFANYDYMMDGRGPEDFISITYSGGEPLMVWDEYVVKSTDYIRSKPNGEQVKIDMFTNGFLLNRQYLEYLRDNKVYTCVSFDGGGQHERSRSQHQYDTIFNNIKLGLEVMGPEMFSVASTFNVDSIADISGTQKIITELGLQKWTIAIDTLHSHYTFEDYETIYNELYQLVQNSRNGLLLPETFNRYQNMQEYFDKNHSYILKPQGLALGTTMPFIMPWELAKDFYIGEYTPDEKLIAAHKAKWGELALGFVGWNDNDEICLTCAHRETCRSCEGLTTEAIKFRKEFRTDGAQCMIPYILQAIVKEVKALKEDKYESS